MTRSPGSALPRLLAAAFLALAAACGGPARTPTAPAPEPEPAGAEQLGDAPEIEAEAKPAEVAPGILGTASYDLPLVANRWVELELDFLVNQRREVIGRWLQRADHYDAWVQDVFAGYGLPRDLHHLAMVESGYVPTARSHAGAVGMWQFMSGTGRGMGLRIDATVDERMDPVRSTHAAARHLKELHRQFGGDWALAAAAYNAGTGRISRGLNRFGVRSFWDLATVGDLAGETRHYVPRLYAVTIIGRDRARFGYTAPAEGTRRFAYDSVQVDVETPLAELARIGGLPLDQLRALNPHLLQGVVPANYWVWTPDGTGAATQVAFQNSPYRREGGYGRYAVRRGDDLGKLAELSGIPVERIRELNPSADPARLRTGQRLVLPAPAARLLSARPAERVAARREDDAAGEEGDRPSRRGSARRTESSSASRESATASRRESARDGEDEDDKPAPRRASRNAAADREGDGDRREGRESRSTRASERTADAERPSASARRSAERGTREHTVEDGETLWAIARRFDVTVDAVKEANDLDDATIRPGQTLRIPRAPSSSPSSSTAAASSSRAASEPSSRTASRERRGEDEPKRAESPRRSESSSARAEGASRTASASRRAQEHVVKQGETLWSIARRYSSTVDSIRTANRLGEQQAIQPGQTLRIPAAASSSGGSR